MGTHSQVTASRELGRGVAVAGGQRHDSENRNTWVSMCIMGGLSCRVIREAVLQAEQQRVPEAGTLIS